MAKKPEMRHMHQNTARPQPTPVRPQQAPSTVINREDDLTTALLKLITAYRTGEPLPEVPRNRMTMDQDVEIEPDQDLEREPFVDPAETEDRRLRSRKVYSLAEAAQENTQLIPDRPSSCRRVFRYLQKYEIGTVKQIAASLALDKKTIGNALSALKLAGLIDAVDLSPK